MATEQHKTTSPESIRKSKVQWPWSRRKQIWDPPTPLDEILSSPLLYLISIIHSLLLALRGAPFLPPNNKPRIRIICISDTHTNTLPVVPDGDILIHAGDLSNAGTVEEIQAQIDWLDALPHGEKIFIAGNHDSYFDARSRREVDKVDDGKEGKRKLDFKSLHYLENESISLEFKGGRKLTFYGSPDIPQCGGSDFAFQYPRHLPPWQRNPIPLNTDVLITHTPPQHHLDLHLGCASLLDEIWRVRPRLHVFGHVHSGHGREPLFWDEAQRSYERLAARKERRGILSDLIPSTAWVDCVSVVWYGVRGILWQWLMVGWGGGSGTLLVNAALVYRSSTVVGNEAEVVDL